MHEEQEVPDGRYEYVILEEPKTCSVCGEPAEEGVEDHVTDAWICSDCSADEGIL